MRTLVLLALVLPVFLITGTAHAYPVNYQVQEGVAGGAPYLAAIPENWNQQLLLIAPGFRPEGVDPLGDVDFEALQYQVLLSAGWIIARTGYRRPGMVVIDGAEDLDMLRYHLIQKFGRPTRIFVEGRSMGGAVAVIVAERYPRDTETSMRHETYTGVLAIGAAMWARDPESTFPPFYYAPKAPILFVSNRDEVDGPRDYIQRCKTGGSILPDAEPVLWIVDRDGHVNITDEEYEFTMRALIDYTECGKIERNLKGTLVDAVFQSTARYANRGAYGTVIWVSPTYGNIDTDFVIEDMEALRLVKGQRFYMEFRDQARLVHYGSAYGEVSEGDYLAFMTAYGNLKIARNMANAATDLGCVEDDTLFIAPAPVGDRIESLQRLYDQLDGKYVDPDE